MAVLLPFAATADTININSSDWLGNLKLDKKQLAAIKKQVTKSLKSPIDTELECGEVRGDCVVRPAREWSYQGNRYREVVIYLHTKGHASKTISQTKGKWPAITTGSEQKKKKSADKKTENVSDKKIIVASNNRKEKTESKRIKIIENKKMGEIKGKETNRMPHSYESILGKKVANGKSNKSIPYTYESILGKRDDVNDNKHKRLPHTYQTILKL